MSTSPTDIHTRLCALLDGAGASYRVVGHEPEGRTELIARIRGNRTEQAIKSIVVQVRMSRKENRYCLANVPGDCRVDLEAIREHFGREGVQPASPTPVPGGTGVKALSVAIALREKAEALTGCVIGAIPPFSFNDELSLLADPLIQENDEVVFNAGRLDRSIFMKAKDYFRIAAPQLVRIAIRS